MPSSDRQAAVRSALRSARSARREDFFIAVRGIDLDRERDRPVRETWLSAELAYQRGDYQVAIRRFHEFENHPHRGKTPDWMRYLSSQRRAFAHLKLGNLVKVEEALSEAEARIAGSPERLAPYRPDLHAMRGHIQELFLDFEGALTSFKGAYEEAVGHHNWYRAGTAASDTARELGILGRHAEGLIWLDRANESFQKQPNAHAQLMLRYRYGMLYAATGKTAEAMAAFNQVIDQAPGESKTGAIVGALARRADLKRVELKDITGAERDLRRALQLSVATMDPTGEVSIRKDLAALLARKESPEAIEQLSKAIDALFRHHQPPPLVAKLLAADVVDNPQLIGKKALDRTTKVELQLLISRLEDLGRASAFHRAARIENIKNATQSLCGVLASLHPGVIELRSCKIHPPSRMVYVGDENRPIRPSEIVIIQQLIGAPGGLTVDELAVRIGATRDATLRRLSRLREAIGDDLNMRRPRHIARYTILLPLKAGKSHS